ncbi:MAG: energy-coupling factor transporter transmembrane protein EcfT [Parasporobacterium sp.]|nr:energy-coupling factor transporter transmembrane protein EcfT [Parasporobacterium sp.]
MFRNITLGQYYPVDSVIHRLDPRVKLLGVVVYIAALFIINNIWGFVLLGGVLAVLIGLSHVPLGYMLKGLRPALILIILAVIFNLFSGTGTIIWKWWILTLTYSSILRAAFFALRLICVILGTGLLTYTTTPTTLTNGLEKVFSHLRFIRFPAHEIAMMMSIALRFIPILAEEVNKITNAQLARGADFETGGFIKKAKGMIPILIPLFVSAFRRAADLATAMEARCYHGGQGRTRLHPLTYQKRDKIAYLLILLFLLAVIALRLVMERYLQAGRI